MPTICLYNHLNTLNNFWTLLVLYQHLPHYPHVSLTFLFLQINIQNRRALYFESRIHVQCSLLHLAEYLLKYFSVLLNRKLFRLCIWGKSFLFLILTRTLTSYEYGSALSVIGLFKIRKCRVSIRPSLSFFIFCSVTAFN